MMMTMKIDPMEALSRGYAHSKQKCIESYPFKLIDSLIVIATV